MLGVSGDSRLAQIPDVPTFKEQGSNCEVSSRIRGSASTSPPRQRPIPIVAKLNAAFNKALLDKGERHPARQGRHPHGRRYPRRICKAVGRADRDLARSTECRWREAAIAVVCDAATKSARIEGGADVGSLRAKTACAQCDDRRRLGRMRTGLRRAGADRAARSYPSRNILLVVPFAAGGPPDVIARVLAPSMSETLGRSIIVENRPGASTTMGTLAVTRAAPDGYTLLASSS